MPFNLLYIVIKYFRIMMKLLIINIDNILLQPSIKYPLKGYAVVINDKSGLRAKITNFSHEIAIFKKYNGNICLI